nr:HEPN domain-containing protein [Phyllobacterium sp. KW56]
MTAAGIKRSATLAKALAKNTHLKRVALLYVESFRRETHPLFAFVAAWSALEGFIKNTSKNSKKRLQKQFEEIASNLNPSHKHTDIKEFCKLYKYRNKFFHEGDGDPSKQVLDNTRALLGKYLVLHLSTLNH